MKNIKYTIIIILLLIQNSQVIASQNTLIIAGDYWCPYNCTPNGSNPGFLVELIRRALHIHDIKVEYRTMSWAKSLEQIQAGKIDGIIGISDATKYNLITTKKPLEYTTLRAFTKSDTQWVYDGPESLIGKKIGIVMDYEMGDDIGNYIGTHYIMQPSRFIVEKGRNAVIKSMTNLIDGDSDLYIEDTRVANFCIDSANLNNYIKDAGKVSKVKLPLYIAFSPDTPNIKQYIKYFETGLTSLKNTGEYDVLRKKYKMDR
ncbi:MAG: transporter substrate-binding domain-containing protein [Rickettsiaceae bacterium]